MSNIETAAPETTAKPAPSLSADTANAIQSKFGNRSVSLSAIADSLSGGAAGDAMAAKAGPSKSAADVAADGFAGGGGAIPHKEEMEASFGTSFGGVKAHTDGAAQKSNKDMGSNALAAGQNISFSTSSPDKGLVAHELTHTLQNNHRGPAASGAAGGGIDASGEGEAEAVQAAVNSGKPASSALTAGTKANAAAQKGGAAPAAAAGGPSLSKKHAPSLEGGEGSKWGAGITFSPEGLEVSGQYTIWNHSVEIPIAAVPGLNAMIEPQVVVKGKVGQETKKDKDTGKEKESVKAALGIEGGVGIGLSYGVPELASLYGVMEASVAGGFEFTKSGKEWELEGSIGLSTVFAVGVKVAGGILDERFEFGKCEIGKLTGIKFVNGKKVGAINWEWGEKPKQFFESIKKVIERAKQLASMAADAAKKVYNGAKAAGKKVVQGVGDAVSWVTKW